ncbi:MAG: ABC transporter ATP-binding protein [Kiritimatiellae bacterium]|nr:ABC transporter ATP-binding protein [Kiritimatiellia bacterium]
MEEHVIELHAVRKVFRDFWRRPTVVAVDGLNLSVRRGEVFGLLGPNGSGKSTTIKMLLGLLRPTSGDVKLLGAAPTDVSVKARIGYLPELSHLHTFLTPRETLHYYASLFGLSRAEAAERTRELLAMVDLESAADRPVGMFSKGMARRVGLAQALINKPELLILDEPTSGLDPIGTREVKDLIRLLAQGGVTILTTSHLLADTEDICDRVAIMDRGVLLAEGPVADLLRRPDAVRFTLQGVDEAKAEALRSRLETECGGTVRQDYPSMSLETYFLQVVSKERKRDVEKFALAPFLRGEGK